MFPPGSAAEAAAAHPHGDAGPPGPGLPWIDWLRFLAALQVVLFHLRLYIFEPYDSFAPSHKNPAVVLWFAVTHFGGAAVLIFFALSGYLVGGSLIERVRTRRFEPAAYAIDRATRLLVPFVPALLCVIGLQVVRHEPVDTAVVLGNLFALQGVLVPVQPYLGVDWSLAYEVWFYVLGGALAACFIAIRRHLLALAVAAVALLVFSALDADLLFCWILGALASQVALRRVHRLVMLAGLIVAGVALVLSNDLFSVLRAHLHLPIVPKALWRILLTLGVLMVLRNLVAIPCRTPRARRLDAIGTRLAAFSYSLYLIHVPILTLLLILGLPDRQDLNISSLLQYVATIAIVLLGGYGFYWAFERHTDTIRRLLKRRLMRGAIACEPVT